MATLWVPPHCDSAFASTTDNSLIQYRCASFCLLPACLYRTCLHDLPHSCSKMCHGLKVCTNYNYLTICRWCISSLKC